ncbi:MAG: ATP-binding protein [Vicinamibacteria bacterium]
MADVRPSSSRLAVGLAVILLGIVNVQGLVQTTRSQTRLRDRMIRTTRDACFAARPRLAQMLRSGEPAAYMEVAREATGASLASEVEVFDFSGKRLFADPAPAPVEHWPVPVDLASLRTGSILTVGPISGGAVRLLTYSSFKGGEELLLLRLAVPAPELAQDLRERRELLAAHAVSLVILVAAAALALFPRGETTPPTRGALDAYEEAMSRLAARGEALDKEHEDERRRLSEDLKDKEAFARAGELTAGIAHEVRNGLGTIVGYARLLERSPPAAEVVDSAARIREECETLETVVRRFMDFVKRETLSLAPFDLGRMLSRVVAREARDGAGPEVLVSGSDMGSITGDEGLIERAFENLVRNAVEAAGPGGHVWIAGARDAEAVAITIADDGPGLSAEARSRIRPFATGKAGGLGLGLPLAQKIIHVHGGDLVLAERPPRGLAATVRLPLAGPPA